VAEAVLEGQVEAIVSLDHVVTGLVTVGQAGVDCAFVLAAAAVDVDVDVVLQFTNVAKNINKTIHGVF